MKRLQRLHHDESGMSLVFIGLGLMALLSASMLAIDVGMLMTARSQAQNSADSGALAGATALLYDDYDDRTATGPAVTSALRAARTNNVMRGTVSVNAPDVVFLANPTTGEQNRVRVTVRRTSDRGNPVPTLIAQYFGIRTANIGATATAEASPANAMTCVKPFTIPDKWLEKQTPPWSEDDTFDAFDKKGNPLPPGTADVYNPAYKADGTPNPDYTGYDMVRDRGVMLTIRAGIGSQISPSMYFSLAMTDDTGGADYRWNIANCNHTHYKWGDPLVQEPGSMTGPTIQGATDLIAQDPYAYWGTSSSCPKGCVMGSAQGQHSVRIFPIPLYDPAYYDSGKRTGRTATLKTANWIGFFLDHINGNEIYGRITPIAGIWDKTGPAPMAALPKTIRLVQ